MISARLSFDVSSECSVGDWINNRPSRSFIEVFASSQIEWSVRDISGGQLVWVGEGPDPFPDLSSPSIESVYRAYEDAEGICITVSEVHSVRGKALAFRVFRTSCGNCPIYLTHNTKALTVSWRFEDAVAGLSAVAINEQACRRFIDDGTMQVRDQVLDGVRMLWPGELANCTADQVSFSMLESFRSPVQTPLAEGAFATDAFMELIREAVEGNLKRAGGAAVELSGGLDSSCVALAVGKAGLSLASYGIVHSGPVGKQQVARRKEVIALAGLRDMTYLARKQRTFASLERAELQITPFDDMYRPHCTAAIERLRKGGDEVDLVLTGMGGDELVKAYTTSRLDYEVAGYLASSAIVAAACRSDAFMRLGVWPKSPLLSKPIVDFCRALPEELRSQRLINVLALARAGLSDAFLFPRYHENFGFIAELSARDFDFDDFFETSAVHETGAYDITGFLIGARKATIFGFEPKFRAQLFQLCKLEVVLRNYLK